MIPFEGVPAEGIFQEIGVLLGSAGNGFGPVLAGVGRDVDGACEGDVVGVLAGAEGEEDEERGAGDEAEDEGGLGDVGVAAEEVDADFALVAAPDDVAGHGDQAAIAEELDALDGGEGGVVLLVDADDGDPGAAEVLLLQPFDAFLLFDAHVKEQAEVRSVLFQERRSHLPVAEVGHEEDAALVADDRLQFLHALGSEGCFLPATPQEAVEMDGGEVLVLVEGAQEMKERAAPGEEGGVEAAAFGDPSPGKEKIAGGDRPGDGAKEPRTAQGGKADEQGVPEAVHRRGIKSEKIRSQMSRLKVEELRRKSRQGRKWLIRTPFGW